MSADSAPVRMSRFEVRVKPGFEDPRAERIRAEAERIGLAPEAVRVARVYLIRTALDDSQRDRLAHELLANPILEDVSFGAETVESGGACVEVHPLPGVMDPPALTVNMAVTDLIGERNVEAATGWRYDFAGLNESQADRIVRRFLANPVIHAIHHEPFFPTDFPRVGPARFDLKRVNLRDLDDDALTRLSREAHLFLSLDEMRAIRDEYRRLGREPTDIELETLAQTWSEHCVHKTLKSTVRYRATGEDSIDWSNRPGCQIEPDGTVVIDNLLRSTIATATQELMNEGVDWPLSVFVDNAGVIAFDEKHAMCVKVETHNHPSAIEPYGGAATGIGGCIRDIIGTGLSAKPIANTDVFCVAFPDRWTDENAATDDPSISSASSVRRLPTGCLHPRRILEQVVAGVRDYGNRVGVPTVTGAVAFDDRFVGNPLVFCGCVGVMPRDKIQGGPNPGDRIVVIGGRTGRDGIHGATFSSAELTGVHAEEFSHAVQIGNPIEEKKLLDAILRARDIEGGPLFSAITDCGAGGFSSAIGEMGEALGAEVHLERVPLKYPGLTYSEIWISEAQERMILAVPPDKLDALRAICEEESVELADLGAFGTPGRELILNYDGVEVGRLPMAFLHQGLPQPVRDARWPSPSPPGRGDRGEELQSPSPSGRGDRGEGLQFTSPSGRGDRGEGFSETRDFAFAQSRRQENASSQRQEARDETSRDIDLNDALLRLLAHPDIASKRWIVRQYDHEVQGATVIKPLVGPTGDGPGDAAVIEPVPGSGKGLAISQGLAISAGDPQRGGDPYHMAIASVDECVRNLMCVGADPGRIAILDNFCWPSCEKPENLGALTRACVGCYDAAKAYRTPFVSGKDSLNNQFTTDDGRTIEIPPTLLITGIGVIEDLARCVTMDAKRAGSALALLGEPARSTGGSRFEDLFAGGDAPPAKPDAETGARHARAAARLIERGLALSAHDCSDGGALVAVAEMCIAAAGEPIGCKVDLSVLCSGESMLAGCFGESAGRYLLEIPTDRLEEARRAISDEAPIAIIGQFNTSGRLTGAGLDLSIQQCADAFFGALDW